MFQYFEENDNRIENYLIYALLGIAIFSRLHFYYNYNGLWLDEAYLSLSIINFDFFDFFHTPLLRNQSAPLGFMLASDLIAGETMTIQELYFIPLISSFLQIYFSYKIIMHCFDRKFLIVYLSLFVSCYALLYYSNEFKQYSSEAAITLFLVYYYVKNKELLEKRIPYTIVGLFILCFLFSTYMIFISAAIGLLILCNLIAQKNVIAYCKDNILQLLIIISFTLIYYYFYLSLVSIEYMQKFWVPYFIPRNIYEILPWFCNSFVPSLENIVLWPNWLLGAMFLLGMFNVYRQRRELFYLFSCIIVILIIASLAHIYPFPIDKLLVKVRLALFWIPLFIIIVASGVHFILEKVVRQKALILCTLLILSFTAVKSSHSCLTQGNKYIELETLVRTVNENFSKKSHLVVINASEAPYLAYQNILQKDEVSGYSILNRGRPVEPQLDTILKRAQKKGKTQIVLLSSYARGADKAAVKYFKEKQYPIVRVEDVGAALFFVDIQ